MKYSEQDVLYMHFLLSFSYSHTSLSVSTPGGSRISFSTLEKKKSRHFITACLKREETGTATEKKKDENRVFACGQARDTETKKGREIKMMEKAVV